MSIHDNVFDLINEIAEPTGPVLSWKAQIHFKQYLNHPEMSVTEIGKAIAQKLRACSLFMEDEEAEYITYNLEHATTDEELDEWLVPVYDICDYARIWCGARSSR